MMSSEEKDATIKKIASEIGTIKRWWPVLMAVGAIIGLTMNLTSTYDNKVAKKDDIKAVSAQVEELSKQVASLSQEFKNYKTEQVTLKKADSNERVNIKKDLDKRIQYANAQFRTLIKQYRGASSFTEKYYIDKNGNRVVRVLPN